MRSFQFPTDMSLSPALIPPNTESAPINGNSEIYVVNTDGTDLKNLTRSSGQDAFSSWSPDGSKIAFLSDRGNDTGDNEIYVMNTDGSNQVSVTSTLAFNINNRSPAWSPDGTKIAYEKGLAISVVNADGSNPVNLTQDTYRSSFPSWSPDGSKIAFLRLDDVITQVYVMNANGSNQLALAQAIEHIAPVWSPDG